MYKNFKVYCLHRGTHDYLYPDLVEPKDLYSAFKSFICSANMFDLVLVDDFEVVMEYKDGFGFSFDPNLDDDYLYRLYSCFTTALEHLRPVLTDDSFSTIFLEAESFLDVWFFEMLERS